jgi:hypothetical protein
VCCRRRESAADDVQVSVEQIAALGDVTRQLRTELNNLLTATESQVLYRVTREDETLISANMACSICTGTT